MYPNIDAMEEAGTTLWSLNYRGTLAASDPLRDVMYESGITDGKRKGNGGGLSGYGTRSRRNRGGNGLKGQIKVIFNDGRPSLTFNAVSPELGAALNSGGVPVRPDGTPYTRSQVLGGELLDGCPMNVITSDGQWLPAQVAAMTDSSVAAAVASCRYPWARVSAPAPSPLPPLPPINITQAPPAGGGSNGSGGGYQAGPPAGGGPMPPIGAPSGGGGGRSGPLPDTTTTPGSGAPTEAGMGNIGMLLLAGVALTFFLKKRR